MSRNDSLNKRTKKLIDKDRLDISKIKKVATENEKNINILEDCKKFCDKYGSVNFKESKIVDLKVIYNEGQGLIDTYFIMLPKENTDIDKTIIRLETIISNAYNTLSTKQIDSLKELIVKVSKESRTTMHKARKIDKELKNKAKQIENLKSEQKSIITTIISIVLAISIIPTAVSGIQNINSNFILPFMASIVLLGIIMIAFTYSIYIERFKKRIAIILVIAIALCCGAWYMSFNYNIGLQNLEEKSINNEIYGSDNTIKEEN